ncbi:MAG: aldo/keto reductase [Eubacteriales bacterium]|nr:aldo/keto reductase [Eubacteriales bacterium]
MYLFHEAGYPLSPDLVLPCIGFGTYKTNDNASCEAVIRRALDVGYRYFDTASIYETERPIGEALKKSGLSREEYMIASKVWIDEMGRGNTRAALERSLSRLQTDYLDLYLIHWPRRSALDPDWKQVQIETWQEMEDMVREGKIRALGLSNFLPHHLDNILEHSTIKPVVDQLELHPGYSQEAAVSYCQQNGILLQAWSPLGRSDLMNHPFMLSLAEKYGRSVSQICIRFLVQRNIMPLVKATSLAHMQENVNIFDFALSREDMQMLSCMPQTTWRGEHPDFAIPNKASNFNQ